MIYSNCFVKKNQKQNLIREKCCNGPKKFQLTTELKLVEPKVDDDSQETITIYTNTKLQPVYFYEITDNDYYHLMEQLTSALFTFASQGNGWILSNIKNLFVKFTSYSPIRGSSYMALPNKFQGCRSLLNIRNIEDENCFIYCFTAAYHLHTDIPLLETSSWRCKTNTGTYNPTYNPLAKSMLATFGCQCRFMNLNDSKNPTKSKSMCLYWRRKICYLSESPNSLVILSWISYCCQKAIILPDDHKNIRQFKNTRAIWFVPLFFYLDTEALLVPLSTCAPSHNVSSQSKLEKHVPCGFAFVIVKHGNDKVLSYRIKRGPDCLDDLIKE